LANPFIDKLKKSRQAKFIIHKLKTSISPAVGVAVVCGSVAGTKGGNDAARLSNDGSGTVVERLSGGRLRSGIAGKGAIPGTAKKYSINRTKRTKH